MCKRWTRFRVLSCLLFLAGAALAAEETTGWRLEKLADGVYAALQPAEKRFDDANSVLVVGERDVLVVDAQTDPEAVRALIAEIAELTDKPVRLVVNTHWHSDHTQGNAVYREVFGDAVVFLGHATLAEDVPARAAADVEQRVERYDQLIPRAEEQLTQGLSLEGKPLTDEQREQQAQGIARARAWLAANRDAVFVPPTRTYEDRLTLDHGGRAIELIHVRAHTRGDTVVFLPREGILATGDVLDDLPFAGHGYPREWIAALEQLQKLEFETIVPGHGPVYRDRAQLVRVLTFFRSLVEQVEAQMASERTLEQVMEAIDVGSLRSGLAGSDPAAQRFFDGVIGEAVERAYREQRGDKLD